MILRLLVLWVKIGFVRIVGQWEVMVRNKITINAFEFSLNKLIGGKKMNKLIENAVETVRNEPKLTVEQLRFNEKKSHRLFDGKTIFESFR